MGANKGIGRETARRLADLGMTVLAGVRDRERDRLGRSAARPIRKARSRSSTASSAMPVEDGAQRLHPSIRESRDDLPVPDHAIPSRNAAGSENGREGDARRQAARRDGASEDAQGGRASPTTRPKFVPSFSYTTSA
jgi:NAD(P)-dependent dehydrogenase (short-subunit alcohol dehydrogenase family)